MQRVLAGRKDPMHLYYYLLRNWITRRSYEVWIDFFALCVVWFNVYLIFYNFQWLGGSLAGAAASKTVSEVNKTVCNLCGCLLRNAVDTFLYKKT